MSASLLFFVQPLFAKMVLPRLGGAPAVWTTAMLFFQTCLLIGYLYAHLLIRFVPPRRQLMIHGAFWIAALFFLPLSVGEASVSFEGGATSWQALAIFATGVGVPFTMLSANAPLIQSWYSRTGGPSADDPYFLYGASNAGSLLALLGFPLLAEPLMGTASISIMWSAGFVLLGGLLLGSGLMAENRTVQTSHSVASTDAPRPGARTVLSWMFLAFVPSSLMLVVTTKISTDLGSFPLVWAIPLSIYILTFILAFSNRPLISDRVTFWMFPPAIAALVFVTTRSFNLNLSLLAILGLSFALFAGALLCHRRLYRMRPDASHLTFFYVIVSIGGALGGFFNLIVAPLLFDTLAEVQVTVVAVAAACCFGVARGPIPRMVALAALAATAVPATIFGGVAFGLSLDSSRVLGAIVFFVMLVALASRPIVLTGFVALLVMGDYVIFGDAPLFRDRSFFGQHVVEQRDDGQVIYRHGTTIHGAQMAGETGVPRALTYYSEGSPMAQLVNAPISGPGAGIGIVGLGVGSLACYATPGQDWQFYEIDPMVVQIATNPALFTFMQTCAPDAPIHIGDARTVLATQTLTYDLLVLDAYSSDAVPVHLLTREAFDIYLDRTTEGGIFALHISNRYYDLAGPIARIVRDMGLTARIAHDYPDADRETAGATGSVVVAVARSAEDLERLPGDVWQALPADDRTAWTDDHANLLGALDALNGWED
nr:fused MFS/spermidine synthase [Jannaschia sp. S6380]